MRVTWVQYGNYAEAYEHFQKGLPETYQAQRYTVDWVERCAREHQTTIICLTSPRRGPERCGENIVWYGRRVFSESSPSEVVDLVAECRPDAVICRTPLVEVLRWCRDRRVACLPFFADYVGHERGLKSWWRSRRLARVLRDPHFACISNHNLNASESLARIGIDRQRIVPWDYPSNLPLGQPKKGPGSAEGWSLLYVGALSTEKGVGDCVKAVALLRGRGRPASLTLVGSYGDGEAVFKATAASLGIGEHVRFAGLVPFAQIGTIMSEHDAVIVPSHHTYPEGLPNTLFEALASATPLILSDHPAFTGRVTDGVTGLVFQAGSADSLAGAVERLMTTPGLYASLSERSADSYRSLYVGMEWGALVGRFLHDPTDRDGWVRSNSLFAIQEKARAQGRRP